MDSVLQQIIAKFDEYIGSLIDVAEMSVEDKEALKEHLLKAQEILLRNGNEKLQQVIGGITSAILSRF